MCRIFYTNKAELEEISSLDYKKRMRYFEMDYDLIDIEDEDKKLCILKIFRKYFSPKQMEKEPFGYWCSDHLSREEIKIELFDHAKVYIEKIHKMLGLDCPVIEVTEMKYSRDTSGWDKARNWGN